MEERIATVEACWSAQPNPSASMPYGVPGYGSTTLASPSSMAPTLSTAPPTTAPSLPITSILFPHSPSQIPSTFDVPAFGAPSAPGAGGFNERLGVPRFSKIEFPSYDGIDDPLNWLHRCEQFFRGQRTLASDRVGLASYHMTGVA